MPNLIAQAFKDAIPPTPKLYAHFFRRSGRSIDESDNRNWNLFLTRDVRATDRVETIPVIGKREARKIATERGAICWNF